MVRVSLLVIVRRPPLQGSSFGFVSSTFPGVHDRRSCRSSPAHMGTAFQSDWFQIFQNPRLRLESHPGVGTAAEGPPSSNFDVTGGCVGCIFRGKLLQYMKWLETIR